MPPKLFLVAWFVFPVLVWGASQVLVRKLHVAVTCVLCVLAIVGGTYLLANYVWALDAYLLAEIDKFEPGSIEADRAADEWGSDTDRSFLLLASPVITAIAYTGLFLILFGHRWIIRQLFYDRMVADQVVTDVEIVESN